MSAFARGTRRGLSLGQAAGSFAAALAASLAWAEADAGPAPAIAGHGGAVTVRTPEAPPSFGDLDPSPLLAVVNAPRAAADVAPSLTPLAEPKFDWASVAETAPDDGALELRRTPAPPDEAAAPGTEQASAHAEPPPPPALSPMQSALQAAVERLVARGDKPNPLGAGDWRAAREAIAAFYAARDYATVWVSDNGLTDAGRAVLSQFERAGDDGLDLSQFALPHGLGAGLAPDAIADAETTIAAAAVAYAEQASGSRIAPSLISPLITAAPSVAEPGAALAETAAAADPAERLADFNPPQKGYRALREELMRLAEEARSHWASPAGDDLDPQTKRAPRLGKGAARGRARGSTDAALASGLLARKRAAILANMEMWRWEPRDMGERRIEINVADFSASVLEGDAVIHQARVIVGKPETPTPIFSNVMRYILINPSWQVPDSIIKKELMPKLDYLSRHGYEVKTVGGRLAVRQLPGETNALGRIAFMFPNEHSVYLHDTPARELFDEETRAFSHGCIRVEDPLSLAELVLGGESGGWPAERIDAAIGGKERTVFLPHPLPIHIEYFTEFVDESGELQERADVYGLTRKVEGMIATATRY